MRKVSGLILVFALAFFAFGCASSSGPAGVSDPTMPPWINEQPPEDMLWGIGVADNQQQNMRMTMADSRARQDIARQMQTLAQGMVVDYAREAGGIDNTAAAQFQEVVSRQVAEATLQGAVRDIMWTTPDNRTLWMRVRISKADAARTVAGEVANAVNSDEARFAEFKAMDALRMMDAQIENNPQSPQPVRN